MKKNNFLIRLWQNDLLYRIYLKLGSFKKKELSLLYEYDDLSPEYYRKIRTLGDIELEHQVGRLTNFKQIIKEASSLEGDLLEFGTWRGFSLLWFAYLMQRTGVFKKKIVGLDGFSGLPASEGPFRKYLFSDVTLKECRNNIYRSELIFDQIKKNIFVEKFMFNQEKDVIRYLKKLGTKKFSIINIDVDISPSFLDVLEILEKGDLIASKAYLLIDDYNTSSSYRKVVDTKIKSLGKHWKVKTHSKTNLTINFQLIKR